MNKPKIRFKGFEGEWKKVKIGDVAPLTGGFAFQSGQFKTSGVPIIRISNILSSGIVGGDFVYYNEFKGDSEFRLYKGDVVIAMSGATTGKVATFEANDFGYQNQRVGKFSRTNLVNYELLSKLVSAPNFQKKIISKLTSSAQPNASSKDIDSIDLVVPEETEEQRALASYFTSLDAQIAASSSRLSSLKQIKAASLLNMFPQKGESVPRVRFKGFQGEWKEVKLSSIAIFSKGQGYSKSDLRENGHPIILYGRMYTKYQFAINEVDTFSNLKGAYVLSEGNEIIMPASGETSEDIACASAVLAKGIILGGDLNIVRFDLKKYSTPFLALTITYSKTHYDLSKCAQGKSVVHLHNEAISKTVVSIPSLPEQRAIASYFTALDAQITLQRERLEKLKQIKAACLEKMFA